MRFTLSIALTAIAAAQLVACNDSPLPTRPPEVGPNKLLTIGGGFPNPTPIPFLNPNDFVSITAGEYHTCARRRNGNVYCWGADDYGQAITQNSSVCAAGACVTVPTLVVTAAQVSAGSRHTCVVTSSGVAWCAGANEHGQLGFGYWSPNGRSLGQVAGGLAFSAISAGSYATCGLAATGVYCWGLMQVGVGSTPFGLAGITTAGVGYYTPQQITSYAGYTSLSVGAEHFCAHMGTPPWSETDCYGSNAYGQLNQDPAQWPSSRGIMLGTSMGNSTTAVSARDNYSCATQSTGAVWCFGWGNEGELGNGEWGGSFWQSPPVDWFQPLFGVTTGNDHACALDSNGLAYCWGLGNFGEVGNNAFGWWDVPQPVVGGHTFRAIAAGFHHTCGISTDNHIWCWGDDSFGQLGASATSPPPVRIAVPVQAMDPTT